MTTLTARITIALFVLTLPLLLAGCLNECQQLCNEMGDYWADCNLPFGDAEVADCRKSFKGGTGSDEAPTLYGQYRGACLELTRTEENDDGEREVALRARFTCDEMASGPGGVF
jgi:hypothetical protein